MEQPVSKIWGPDAMACEPFQNGFIHPVSESALHSGIYTLFFILAILTSFKYIHRTFFPILSTCFQFSKSLKIQEDLSVRLGKIILFTLSLFHFALMGALLFEDTDIVIRLDLGPFLVPLLFLLFMALFFLKVFLQLLVGWITGQTEALRFLAFSQREFFTLAAVLSLPLSLASLFELKPLPLSLIIWLFLALALAFLFFQIHSFRYFLYARFSLFFWFLYLCSLEIIPIALLYRLGIALY
jgi:hypothetical protein